MRVFVASFVLASACFLGPVAHAATPAPSPVATATAEADTTDTTTKPWGRLVIFVPIAIVIGASVAFARRYAAAQGWTQQ